MAEKAKETAAEKAKRLEQEREALIAEIMANHPKATREQVLAELEAMGY